MELQNIKRLAVFKMRNIGDVLIITPVLRALRETFPDAKITVVVNSGTEAMLAHNPHIDEVLAYERGGGKRGHLGRLVYELDFARQLRSKRFDMTWEATPMNRPLSTIPTMAARLACRASGTGISAHEQSAMQFPLSVMNGRAPAHRSFGW